MKQQVGDLRTVTQRFDGEQWVLCLQSMPPRELSDEEIMDICIMGSFYDRISDPYYDKKTGAWSLDEDLVQFAKAILKKASEKWNHTK